MSTEKRAGPPIKAGGSRPGKVQIYVRPFHADTWEMVARNAADEGMSLSEYVSRAIAHYVRWAAPVAAPDPTEREANR